MIKKLIAPFQRVLMSKGLCPGCTLPLSKAKTQTFNKESDMVICKCKRMFIRDKNTDSYRRATIKEEEEFRKK